MLGAAKDHSLQVKVYELPAISLTPIPVSVCKLGGGRRMRSRWAGTSTDVMIGRPLCYPKP